MERCGLRLSLWMSPTRIDGCERSTFPMCLQTPPRTTRRGLMSSAQMFRNQIDGCECSGCCLHPQIPSKTTLTHHDDSPHSRRSPHLIFLRFAFTSGTRIVPHRLSLRKRPHNRQKLWPMLRPRRSTHAKLTPHKGDTRHLVYLHLDVKIGVAQPEMIELGA